MLGTCLRNHHQVSSGTENEEAAVGSGLEWDNQLPGSAANAEGPLACGERDPKRWGPHGICSPRVLRVTHLPDRAQPPCWHHFSQPCCPTLAAYPGFPQCPGPALLPLLSSAQLRASILANEHAIFPVGLSHPCPPPLPLLPIASGSLDLRLSSSGKLSQVVPGPAGMQHTSFPQSLLLPKPKPTVACAASATPIPRSSE